MAEKGSKILQTVKERFLMTSFLFGHLVDSAMSYYHFMQEGWKEIGFLAGSPYLEIRGEDKILIAKMGVVAAVIGIYALANDMNIGKVKKASEVALKVGNAAVWAVQAWNIFNIVGNRLLTKG